MSAFDKQYVIKLDLNKETYNEDMEFSISDLETSDFWIDIKKSRKAIDFTYCSITLYITKPNGNIRTIDIAFDEENKMHYCNLPADAKNLLGNYEVQVVANNFGEEERLVIPNKFKYHVVSDILNDTYENIEEVEDTFKQNYDALLYDIGSIKAKNLDQDEKIDEVREYNIAQDEKISSLEEHNTQQDYRLLTIENLNNGQNTEINSIKEVNDTQDSQIQSLDKELDELTSTVNSNAESMRQGIDEVHNEINEVHNEINEIHNELNEKDLTLEDLTDRTIQNTLGINDLEDKYEEKFLEIEEQISVHISTSNTRLTSIESKNATQDTRMNSVESKYTSLNNVVDTVRTVNSNQTVEINNLKNRVTTLEKKISELEALISTLQGGKE